MDQHGLQGIATVSYKTYRYTYRNTYQISRYVSLVEKVYRYTPSNENQRSLINTGKHWRWRPQERGDKSHFCAPLVTSYIYSSLMGHPFYNETVAL